MPPSSFLNYALSLRPATLNILYSEGLPNNPSLNPLTPPTPAAADVFSKTILSTLPNLLPRGNWACRTILSTLLSTQERVLVLRLSVLPSPATVTEPTFRSWFTNAAPTLNYLAEGVSLPKLVRLAIITVSDDPNTAGFITLQTPFHSQLRLAIASTQQSPWKKPGEYSCATSSPGNDLTTDEGDTTSAETGVDPQALELYTQARWDEILHYLVGSSYTNPPSAGVVSFLIQVGLMKQEDDATYLITSKGYDFMLQDVHLQVWQLVLQYLTHFCEKQANADQIRKEALLFLFALSHCKVGTAYNVSRLSGIEKQVMLHFQGFGLIMVDKPSGMFYPTRVAVNLLSGAERATTESANNVVRSPEATKALNVALTAPTIEGSPHLAIIVQTNFSVVAYTASELHMAMLGLFCDGETMVRLPNMIVAMMTRDSVKNAFALGITATQILKFLKMHAHPSVLTDPSEPILPSNVEDQVWLWDRERKRIKSDLCFKLQCIGTAQYEQVLAYSRKLGGLLFKLEERQLVFVKFAAAEKIVQFRAKLEQQAAQQGKAVQRQSSYN